MSLESLSYITLLILQPGRDTPDFNYFGVESGIECYGGNNLQAAMSNGDSAACNYACAGDDCQVCGGEWAISIYITQLVRTG